MYVYKPKKAVAQARHAGPITMGVGSGFSASSALEADGRSPATRNVASRKGKFSNQSHSLQKDGYTYKVSCKICPCNLPRATLAYIYLFTFRI